MSKVKRITACRVCKNKSLISCIDLGSQYLSSVFPTKLDYRKSLRKYPLELVLCRKAEDTCGTLQLAHVINIDSMYEFYPFSSSTNSSMPGILRDVVDETLSHVKLEKGDLVLDIGGNDGTLLSFFKNKDLDLLTIDPAQNIKQVFSSPKYKYVQGFFNKKLFKESTDKKAKLIFSIAMYYHLSDPIGFSKDVESVLDKDGVWVIQMAYLPRMIKTNMYDNIVHEHVGYYTTHNLEWIMDKAGLSIFDVSLNDVYGGSFRIFLKRKDNNNLKKTKRLEKILQAEENAQVNEVKTYTAFMSRIKKTRKDLLKLIKQLRSENKKIWIYGASTKGNTILQYCDITLGQIEAAADSNPFKLNKYIIGGDIPIKSEDQMRKAMPDYLLALPYSFIPAFLKRENKLVKAGTKFIAPLPQVKIFPEQ